MRALQIAQVDIERMKSALEDSAVRDFGAGPCTGDERLVGWTGWSAFEPCPAGQGLS